MGILVISPSPLFKDVLAGILVGRELDGVSFTEPVRAAAAIEGNRPRVTLVDEATDAAYVAGILAEVRKLPSGRLIFLGQERNSMVVFVSHMVPINEVGDFIEAVSDSDWPVGGQTLEQVLGGAQDPT